jgi:hypothetical protein
MYEKAGFKRMAEFEGWPEGHSNVILCKTPADRQMSGPGHSRPSQPSRRSGHVRYAAGHYAEPDEKGQ